MPSVVLSLCGMRKEVGVISFPELISIRFSSFPDWIYAFSVTLAVWLLFFPLKKNVKSVFVFCVGEVVLCAAFIFFTSLTSWIIDMVTDKKFYAFNLATDIALTVCYSVFVAVPGRFSVKSRAVMIGILYVAALTLQQMVGTMSVFVGNILDLAGAAIEWVRNFVNLLLVAVSFFLLRFELGKFNFIPASLVVMTAIISVTMFALRQISTAYIDVIASELEASGYMLILYALILFVILLTHYIMYSVCRNRDVEIEREKEYAYLKATETMLRIADSNMCSLREIKHDMRNQIASMALLFVKKDYSALQKFFMEYSADVNKKLEYIDCGNVEVSAVLNLERSKAIKAGISFEYNAAVPEVLPIKSSELCSILTNCIDNAVEACVRENIAGAYVKVNIGMRGDYLRIYVENPTVQKRVSSSTLKGDKREHGYGKKIVKNIVSRYCGVYNEGIKDGLYKVSVYLNIKDVQTCIGGY